jgi:hypothetical protein
LTLDNGAEIIAKIPDPNAGPTYFTVACEVATLQFLRDVLESLILKVLRWSSGSKAPVEAKYSLEE